MRKTVEVQMDAGMEARPIALMVQTANQFSSHLYLASMPAIFIWSLKAEK